jgi:glycine/D-amino acid oxidase-like deaminating enzyme
VTGVRTGDTLLTADRVVLAAGTGSKGLAASIGIDLPLEAPPGLLVYSEPAPRMLNGVVLAPGLHMRQTDAGRIVAGADFAGGMSDDDPRDAADHLFSALRLALRDGERLSLSHFTFGRRPMPADGFPIIGTVEGHVGLYVAVTHSGITLAPAIGTIAVEEIATGMPDPMLAPFRLARFG